MELKNEGANPSKEDRDILRNQLELLAARSKHCTDDKELAELSAQMVSVYSVLYLVSS